MKKPIKFNKNKYPQMIIRQIDYDLIDEKYINSCAEYYQNIGWNNFNPVMHILCDQKTGNRSKYIIPLDKQYRSDIINTFNDVSFIPAYSDKNLYDVLVKTDRQPRFYLKCINGRFFNGENKPVAADQIQNCLKPGISYIIKPSRTANGLAIKVCYRDYDKIIVENTPCTAKDLFNIFSPNFLIQEKISQYKLINDMHPDSVNTLRVFTLRWDGQIRYLSSVLRIGANGKIFDNASSGGVCVGINDDGKLNKYGITFNAELWYKHPTTSFDFRNEIRIPNFDKFKDYTCNLHEDIPHHDLVSWDIAVGEDGLPFFLEHNFKGSLSEFQLSMNAPFFKNLSPEIIDYIINYKKSGKLFKKIAGIQPPLKQRVKNMIKHLLGRPLYIE